MPRGRRSQSQTVQQSRPNVRTRGQKRRAEEEGDPLRDDPSMQGNADVWVMGRGTRVKDWKGQLKD